MAYYVRAFCTSPTVPALRDALGWAAQKGCVLMVEESDAGLDSSDWQQATIVYREGRSPLLSEISRDDGSDDSLLREEIEEFEELVSEAEDSRNRKKVLGRLRRTKYVVAVRVPSADFDEDGYNALGCFLAYFVEHCGGMVQADGEGFYEGDTLIVGLG